MPVMRPEPHLRTCTGGTLWFTGLSGAGKTTLADGVAGRLAAAGRPHYRLDGDVLRTGLCRDLGFSPADRAENIRRAGEVAFMLADAGVLVLAAFVSPFAADRAAVRRRHAEAGLPFMEIFVDAPLEEVRRRDVKGLYARAGAGQVADLTGVGQAYERPEAPELALRTDLLDREACLRRIEDLLRAQPWRA